MENIIQPLINDVVAGRNLSYDQCVRAFQVIMNGGATPAQIAALLVALRMKGETVEEITAAAVAMRAKAAPFPIEGDVIDTCGTGGDARGTLNISTAVAIVLAACDLKVVKHGNRAVSSSSGSADVLEKLSIRIDAEKEVMQKSLEDVGICFLMAPLYHKAMRHVAPIRKELAMRTIFNLLGPLSNPAQPQFQLIGVYAREWVEPLAHVCKELGLKRAWVVHGHGGLDELSLSGPSYVAELNEGKIYTFEITPDQAGLEISPVEALKGGDATHNAQRLSALLTGEKSAYRDAVIYNAAAGLVIAGKAENIAQGASMAAMALDEGQGLRVLQLFMNATHGSKE